jgi:nicotinamide-nucleotide amidase
MGETMGLETMHDILAMGARAGELLKARGETIAIGETSAGGLISASLLAVTGASAYFQGGAITYARPAITGFAGVSLEEMRAKGIRSSSEPYALMLAHAIRERIGSERSAGVTWALSETGAAGPNGNPYGDASGHTCMAVVGDNFEIVRTLETGIEDRVANMWAFAEATLALLVEVLETAPA